MTARVPLFLDDFLRWLNLSKESFDTLFDSHHPDRFTLLLAYALSQQASEIHLWKEGESEKYGFGARIKGINYQLDDILTGLTKKLLPTTLQNEYALTLYLFDLDELTFHFRVQTLSVNNQITHMMMRVITQTTLNFNTMKHTDTYSEKIALIQPIVHSLLLKEKLDDTLPEKINVHRLKI